MNKKTSVVLVDDHNLFRKGIAELVNGFLNFKIVGEFENGQHFLDHLEENVVPDIVLMDINMPVKDGYETMLWLNKNNIETKVIVLSMYDDENAIIKMMKYGARGYLLKDAEPDELEKAMEEVRTRDYYYSALVSDLMLKTIKEEKRGNSILNDRELEFLQLACSELTYKQIAAKMFVSPRTIDGYRESLCQKLNLKNRIGLVLYAIKHGIYIVE